MNYNTATQEGHLNYTMREWSNQGYQLNLAEIFKDNDIKTIYDIGANTGGSTLSILNYCERENKNWEKVYCFEPDLENINFLKDLLSQEIKKDKVIPIQTGVYYGLKSAKAFGMGVCNPQNSIHPNVGGMGIEECMKAVRDKRIASGENVFCDQVGEKIFTLDTLENLCKDFPSPDLVKIDVEGAEANILENSELIKNSKYILAEWNQEGKFQVFLDENLPHFEIILDDADFLLKNKNK